MNNNCEFLKLTNNEYSFCEEKDANYVLIPKNEYYGLKKAVRIVQERALQQVDKSKTDKYGYRLLRADLRYNKEANGKLWLVTKETPYSCKMPLLNARYFIETQLREIYTWADDIDLIKYADMEIPSYELCTWNFTAQDLAKIVWQRKDKAYKNYNWYVDNSDKGRAMKKAYTPMILGISKIAVNYAQGLYEVSYWASESI